jgi:hypothetical protein
MTDEGRKPKQTKAFSTTAMQSQLTASGMTPQPMLVFDLFFFFTAVKLDLRPQAVSALNPTHPSSLLAFLLAVGARGRLCESWRMMRDLGVWAKVTVDCSASASLSLRQSMGRCWFWGCICDGNWNGLNPSICC